MRRVWWLLLLLPVSALAQQGNTVMIRYAGAPTGACSPIAVAVNNATGDFYDCLSGAWHLVSGSGGGTVNSGTAGQLAIYATTGTAVSGDANLTHTAGVLQFADNTANGGSFVLSSSQFPDFIFGPNGTSLPRGQLCYANGAAQCASAAATNDIVLAINGNVTGNLIIGSTNNSGTSGGIDFNTTVSGLGEARRIRWTAAGLMGTYNNQATAVSGTGIGLSPEMGDADLNAQTGALGPTTLLTTVAANSSQYLVSASVYCTTSSAAAQVGLSISYTDPSSTVQTISPTNAVCTTLGPASFAVILTPIQTKGGTTITYTTTITSTPTYNLRVELYQLSLN